MFIPCLVVTVLFAPITGAWIETEVAQAVKEEFDSHLSQVRGLKLFARYFDYKINFAPITGAWIETLSISWHHRRWNSHLSQVRGLKL